MERGLTPTTLGDKLGVDHKTVERWISGPIPYRRHRYAVAAKLGVDEVYLWPNALSREQVASASDEELLAIYPHRSDVPPDAWQQLFRTAEREIGVLVFSGLWLPEDAGLLRTLVDKAKAGVRVRVLLGDPESSEVAARGADEGLDDAMSAESATRSSSTGPSAPSRTQSSDSTRRSSTTRSTAVTTPPGQYPRLRAPCLARPRLAPAQGGRGEIASTYMESFERVWETAAPAQGR